MATFIDIAVISEQRRL